MKLGILGGTFNPLHIGHVRMAIEAREALELDMVELVPTGQPPHKNAKRLLPFELRMEMVERSVKDIPGLNGNPIEGQRSGPSFTCDTLTCYQEEKPESELHFIMGAATFLEIPTWNRGLDIPAMANLAVVSRWDAADRAEDYIKRTWPEAESVSENEWVMPTGNRIRIIEIPRLDVKASYLRERWLKQRSIHLLVPDQVEAMLEEKRQEVTDCWND